MAGQASLLGQLKGIVGNEHAYAPQDERPFAVDGLTPQAVVEPGSYEEVAAAMRYANDNGLAVIPWGGGTMMHIGNVPRSYAIAVNLSRLNRVIEYEPADLTVTCEAGLTLHELQRRLQESRQMLPFVPIGTFLPTVGGVLAANFSGWLRLGRGTPRDSTIGLRVVTADGRITRAGGKVVKNVAGYDLCKLYIGSRGTLGIIVEATFKLTPLSAEERRIELEFQSLEEACVFATDLVRAFDLEEVHLTRPADPFGGVALNVGYALSIGLRGSASGVERSRREITALSRTPGVQPLTADRVQAFLRTIPDPEQVEEDPLSCIASILPSRLPDLIQAFKQAAPGPYIWSDLMAGTVLATWLGAGANEGLLSNIRAITAMAGGTVIVDRCAHALKERIDVFGDLPPSFELMRRIKQQFDPKAILSPGRFLGRL